MRSRPVRWLATWLATWPATWPATWRRSTQGVLGLSEAPWRWSAGVRAAIATGGPLAAFALAGHASAGLVAALGAFTALYGASLPPAGRLTVLPWVGAGFVAASALGVLCAGGPLLAAAGLVAAALVAGPLAFRVRLGPPGPMMFMLVAGISGHVAGPGGAAMGGPLVPALVAVGALAAYALVIAPLALPSVRRQGTGPPGGAGALAPAPLDREARIILARIVAAVALAGLVSLPLGVNRAYWVAMVAGSVLQASHVRRLALVRIAQRVLGTVLGLGLFGVLAWARPGGVWLAGTVALLQFAVEVVVARNYGLGLVFITPLALTISAAGGGDDPLWLAGERVGGTLLGAGVALAVLWAGDRAAAVRG